MLKVRLKRVGRKNDPSFRIVVVDSKRGPKSNKFVDSVGFYNPQTKERSINGESIRHWISAGAQVSDTVHNMLVDEGVIEGKKINVLPMKSPLLKEVETEVAKTVSQSEKETNVESDIEKSDAEDVDSMSRTQDESESELTKQEFEPDENVNETTEDDTEVDVESTKVNTSAEPKYIGREESEEQKNNE